MQSPGISTFPSGTSPYASSYPTSIPGRDSDQYRDRDHSWDRDQYRDQYRNRDQFQQYSSSPQQSSFLSSSFKDRDYKYSTSPRQVSFMSSSLKDKDRYEYFSSPNQGGFFSSFKDREYSSSPHQSGFVSSSTYGPSHQYGGYSSSYPNSGNYGGNYRNYGNGYGSYDGNYRNYDGGYRNYDGGFGRDPSNMSSGGHIGTFGSGSGYGSGYGRYGRGDQTMACYGTRSGVPRFTYDRPQYPTNMSHEYDARERDGPERRRFYHDLMSRFCGEHERRRFYDRMGDEERFFQAKSPPAELLHVENVDFRPMENAKEHRTFAYEMVLDNEKPTPVYRRGQVFNMTMTFRDRDFDPNRDYVFVNFLFGPNPSVPKRTRIVLPLMMQREFSKVPHRWDMRMQQQDQRRINLQVHIPATCPVGPWRCVVETAMRQEPRTRCHYKSHEDIFILFNPYCQEDAAYMDNEACRMEYMMNDTGKVWIGGSGHGGGYDGGYRGHGRRGSDGGYSSSGGCFGRRDGSPNRGSRRGHNYQGRPWAYGQYSEGVLPVACLLLEMAPSLSHADRGNCKKVARALSYMLRYDRERDLGMMMTQYEGEFRGGQSPHLWTGTTKIVEEFLRSGGKPVKYAHCWVMSAVLTSLLRSLGLCSRTVTAMGAPYDTQDTCVVDRYLDRWGDPMDKGPQKDQSDELWAFRSWTEIYMQRYDMSQSGQQGQYGWQALDPARSRYGDGNNGSCGPCPIDSVRRGEISDEHDTSAMFSTINADVKYYFEDEDSEWGYTPFKQYRYPVARAIITKAVGQDDDEADGDAEDVSRAYKDHERSMPEKSKIFNACRNYRRDLIHYDYKDSTNCDVTFEIQEPNRTMAGQTFDVMFNMMNNSNEPRNVHACIATRSCFYTGVTGQRLKRVTGQMTLAAGQRECMTLRLDPNEYQDKMVDMGFMRITASAYVNETKQTYVEEYDFRFEKPRLRIERGSEWQVGQESQVAFNFSNPLDVTLTDCYLSYEAPGCIRPRTVQVNREVRPREQFSMNVGILPRRPGEYRMIAAFCSRQLSDITGSKRFQVRG